MKHIFVINPAAGKENATERIKGEIERCDVASSSELYLTEHPGDAVRYVRDYCKAHSEPVRFYACGGDGTLNEVANGVAGIEHASIGCIPSGSGNDFIKYYGGMDHFKSVSDIINGEETPIDLIRVGDRYAINAVHFGLDSCVAQKIQENRRKKIIGGRNAYPSAVVYAILFGMRHTCTVRADGDVMNPSGEVCLCTIANGQYVGGSYHCAPKSSNHDGLLDVCVVDVISRITFLKTMGAYQRGEHLNSSKYGDFIYYKRASSVQVTAPSGFIVSMDGELLVMNEFVVELEHHATRFVVPRGAKSILKEM